MGQVPVQVPVQVSPADTLQAVQEHNPDRSVCDRPSFNFMTANQQAAEDRLPSEAAGSAACLKAEHVHACVDTAESVGSAHETVTGFVFI